MSTKRRKAALGSPRTAGELLDSYYLHMRSALLETAAGLDRVQAADGGDQAMNDPRVLRLKEACLLIGGDEAERAERFQQLLSVD